MADGSEHQELPWTEQQWDAFMRRADLRSARYAELMETLLDEPNRDDLIDHEMGWDRKADDADSDWAEELERAAAEVAEGGEDPLDARAREQDPGELLPESVLDRHPEKYFDESDRQLWRIPAYHLAMELSNRIDAALKPLFRQDSEDEPHEDVAQAYIQIKIAAAKIAGGHGMGYHDDVLGGNVVNCRRALEAVKECGIAIQALVKAKMVPDDAADLLLKDLNGVSNAINARIEELRSRMWWQKPV